MNSSELPNLFIIKVFYLIVSPLKDRINEASDAVLEIYERDSYDYGDDDFLEVGEPPIFVFLLDQLEFKVDKEPENVEKERQDEDF